MRNRRQVGVQRSDEVEGREEGKTKEGRKGKMRE